MIVAAAAAAVAWTWRGPNAVSDEVRLEINAPPTTDPTSLAISPDGQTVAFVGISDGQSAIMAAVTRCRHGATVAGNRERDVSVLVAGWSFSRVCR